MASCKEAENSRYKLLGFDNKNKLAIIMVISTGKVIKTTLTEIFKSEISDNLNKMEIRDICKKLYASGNTLTAYELKDRNERSWMIYVTLNMLMLTIYFFTNIAASKLIYLGVFDVVITPGVFLYPLTFLIVDILNESYGLRLARKAILFALLTNILIIVLLNVITSLPGLPGWKLDAPFTEVMNHAASAIVASSVSFLFSEHINSYLICKIRKLTNSKYLFIRVFFSTFFSVIIDTFLFCYIAFHGKINNDEILNMIYVQIAIKMCFAVFNIFPAYGARALFKRYINAAG